MSVANAGVHIEHLFATPLVVDVPPIAGAELDALRFAARRMTSDVGQVSAEVWSDKAGGPRVPEASGLIGHIRHVASTMTIDVRSNAAPSWEIGAVVHLVQNAAQPEIAARHDAYWSGLYILEDGYAGRADPSAGGELIVFDPRLPAPMMEAPQVRLLLAQGAQRQAYVPELSIRPSTGQLFLFPSWMRVQQRARPGGAARLVIAVSLVAPPD